MKIRKDHLLLIAGLVWLAAGLNLIYIAFKAADHTLHPWWLFVSVTVFLLFFFLVFVKLVDKHTNRIMGYEEKRVFAFKFFDPRSYFIMIFMISLGVGLRVFNVLPDEWISMVYTGIGASLVSAAVGFFINFAKAIKSREVS